MKKRSGKPIRTAQDREQRAKELKLTRKQKAFADLLIDEPKIAQTQAALMVYGKPDRPTTYQTAGQIAEDNLKKPQILKYLDTYGDKAERVVIDVMDNASKQTESASFQRLAADTANSILDRVHGKATTRLEVASTSLNITIDLTQSTTEAQS